jgi:amino acid adenylation domain-containing protein
MRVQSVLSLISELEALDVRLRIEEGKLRYSAPKGVLDKQWLDRIVANKSALMELLAQRTAVIAVDPESDAPIARQSRDQGLPLSSAQQRFWFLDQLDYGNSAAFVVPPMTLRLHGPLHVEALRDALVALIERHEVLRSAFRIEGKEPVQVALNLAKGHSTLRLEDITNQAPEQQAQHVRELIRHEALTPFDLQRGDVLMRARLLELAANEHVLILTMHHIIADGWSMGILVDELSHLYRALAADPACDPAGVLPPLPIQYADYAHWERRRLSGTRFERLRSYWLQQLSGAPEVLPLPTDLHRPRVRSNRGAAEHFQLDADLSARLVQLAREAAVTPFMLLLAAFGVLLCRYTDREDIVIGSPTGARPHPQTEGLIGLFLNTLALRLDLSGNPGFHELLARVRGVALGAFEHGDMPFEQILQALDLQRNLDHTPLFQVLFALQNAPLGEVTLEGLRITPEPMESLHAPFDLVLSLEETANGIKGFFRYNTDLFVASTVQRMVGHYQRLLRSLLAAPDCGIRQLSYIGSDEIAQLRQWRGGVGHFDASIPLHQRFQAIAATRPDACAVRFGEQTLSYGQLERRSNQLAAHLRRLGVQRGDRVGLCTERSLELVIGILGILKCGSAYVPLDPAYPEDRQRYMAEDSALQVVVVLGALPPLRASLVDLADAQWQTEDDAAVIDASTPTDVAYVIYTSGSTGRPKGVEVTHANVVRLFTATESLFGFGPCDVWTLFHSYAFDFSVWELWGALLYGGRLVVVPYAISRSPDQFLSLLADAGVTVLNQTPSAFRQLIEADRRLQAEAAPALALKWVIFGGEALDPRSLQNWVQRRGLEAPQLINMYGITETTVHVTYQRLTTADISAGGSVIGRALPDLSIELVDRYGQAVPIGVAGEIWVGGAGLAKGYLNQPELTAQRFVNQPSLLDQAMPVRQYRSGDLARWRADGRLDYLGRIDLQVKIRGFRIELGEIESCLAAIPGVSEAFVEARQEAVGARLIAYVVTAAWQDPALPSALRAQLRQQLPDYMVPTALHPLERFPLTSNGKLDRKQLAALVEQRAAAAAQDEAVTALAAPPQTELEFLLAELWREALGIHQVGLDDNFFELGGDSIRGAILINQLQEQIRSVVHVVALFEAPTIRQFVEFLQVNYPDAVARLGGQTLVQKDDTATALIDEAAIARFRALIPPLPAYVPKPLAPKNPRAIFVLSPPRSGSTLLRVLLGGHPALFSPPELELLGFEALGERRRVCSGRDAFWLEGTLRAVMQALQVDADTAKDLMAEREDADMGVKEFYGELQSWLGGKILVDKSPSYALDVGVMQRAEAYFERPLYLHLHRHPYGMISSFEEARLNQIFFRYPHDLKVRELAELIWLQSHRNIVEFLATIPPERQMAISFEDITRQPEASTRHLCDFMGIAFTPEMLEIYGGERKQQRMTDGIYRESKMLGDIKFHTHQKIDPGVAERWRKIYRTDFLGDASWQMAQTLGYVRTAPDGVMPILPLSAHVRSAALPLSLAQQRLWFLDQLEGAGSAYHMPVALRLYGSLNEAALLQSLHHIVQRHEGLRAFFTTQGDEPAVMLREPWTPVVVEDLSSLAGDEHEAEMLRRVREEATQPFDLARGPLFRSRLLRLDAQQHVIVVNMHHIVSDGWSLGILVAEWGKLYNALAAGTDAQLPALPVQYADYAQWQRSYLSGERLQRQLDYWRGRMAGAPALLELPTDRPRPAIQTFAGCSLAFALDNTLATALRRFADEAQVSLYMLLLAAFGILLSRYSGQTDIVIGSPTANRSRKEIEGLIGFFMNTIVMRLAVDPVQRFDDYLAQVRQLALQAYAHQDVSFEQLVEKLRPQRNLSYSPLFQVMFSLQSAPATIPALTGLEVKEITLQQPIAKYDLTLAITDRNGVLNGMFEFATDLFDAATIERMAANFQTLLGNIVAASPGTLAQLPLLSNPERQLLLTDWNATQKVHGGCATLHGLFEAQVARTPTAIAVQARDGRLSYTELDARAEAVANRLRACGVGSGGMVGLCLRRTLDLPVALLAILKTGNAYVPLDPDYPAERIRYVLQDAAVGVLLTQTVLADALSSADYAVVCVDAPQTDAAVRLAPADREKIASSKAALAYVIYTSGSTGRPKGVMISHLAAVNFIESMQREPGMTAHDTLLAVTTISFDIAVLELYLPLSVGARIVLADEAMTRDAAALMQTLIDEHITLMQATPATWRLLLAAGWAGAPQLKILCGGEALPASLGEVLLGRCASLWNMYGPTETTVWSTLRRVDPDDTARATVPIGHPIGNTRIYILDALQQPQPIGVSGELFIAGEGVAEGYLGRPDLTAERFLVDPFMLGGRMYWTGDRARYLADGRIEFLGRGDQQIKVRGYRVELGEIEHVLAQQPGVTVCAIGLDQNSQGEARLVAYYVGAQADRQMLRQALRDVLPDYMVPSLFVALEQLPLTPNGKIDRKALRVPDDALRVDVNERVLSRDATELALSRVWEEVLHVAPIGIHDNFFDLGGHSLVAVRLMARVAQQFGRTLPLASLFQAASVAAMARLLRDPNAPYTGSSLVTVRQGPMEQSLYCVAGAGGNVVYLNELAAAWAPHGAFFALQPPGLDGHTPILESVEELAAHYIKTIVNEQGEAPRRLAGHSFGGLVAFEMARQLIAADEPVEALILLDTPAPQYFEPTGRDWSDAQWLAQVSQIASHMYGVETGFHVEELSTLPAAQQFACVHARLIATGVLPEGTPLEFFRGFVDVYKANLRARYEVSVTNPIPDFPRTLLLRSANEQPEHLVAATAQPVRASDDFGWNPYLPEPVRSVVVPGDHLTMLHTPATTAVAAAITDFLLAGRMHPT